MTPGSALSVLVAEIAEAVGGVEVSASARAVEYALDGRVFAVVEGDALVVDLGATVAAAAVRTPDTRPSERGSDWVRFEPGTLDRFARDRATAWFESARRRAAGRASAP